MGRASVPTPAVYPAFFFVLGKAAKAQETQSYQRFQHIVHTDFNTSGTNGPRSLFRMKAGTHSPSPAGAHTAAHRAKQGRFSEECREPAGQRCAYARRCSAGVAAPLGCAASFAIWRCCFFSLCVRYFLHVRGKGGYHHSRRALHVVETPDARLSKRLTRRFLALPDSSLIPAAQNIVPFLYRCQKDQRDTR